MGSSSKRALALVKALDDSRLLELSARTAAEFHEIWPRGNAPDDVAAFFAAVREDGFEPGDAVSPSDSAFQQVGEIVDLDATGTEAPPQAPQVVGQSGLRPLHMHNDPADTARKIEAVFLVHGQSEAMKETVARFMERLGLTVVVLHEQPNRGRTIIEKFEDHTDVAFAVVLLTGDDQGGPKGGAATAQLLRARQNVIFELGFFMAKLGRGKVCALYEREVEIPSDFRGIAYIALEGDWRLELARELRAAGLPIDLNSILKGAS